MDKNRDQKRLLTKQISVSRHEEDRLSNLSESLLCRIMLNLRTKDVVQSCVLSKRWRNLWRYVPALNVEYRDFRPYNAFVSFINMFLVLNREYYFQSCSLKYLSYEDKRIMVHVKDWINIVSNRKVKELAITDDLHCNDDVIRIPMAVYTCESLVSLELDSVILANPKLISLPFVKVINLGCVKFANGLVLEKLISSCPVLESVYIYESSIYDIDLLRVCSQYLLSFKLIDGSGDYGEQYLEVEIDAPKLEYLSLHSLITVSFRIKNLESLVEADIDIIFDMEYPRDLNNIPKINMIRDFLLKISCVKKLSISCNMVQEIFDYVRCGQPLAIFHNLSFLNANITDQSLKMLSTFLESCPNLKSLLLSFGDSLRYVDDGGRVLSMPQCLLTSLEYVKIESLIKGNTRGMKLVSYFLENSAVLKKLTLRVAFAGYEKIEDYVIFKEF